MCVSAEAPVVVVIICSMTLKLQMWLCTLCSQQFTDLASLSALAKYTTGGVYCYPGFNPARDAPKLQTEIKHNLTRQTGLVFSSKLLCYSGLIFSLPTLNSLAHAFAHSRTCSFTSPTILSLNHSLAHSLTHSLTFSLTFMSLCHHHLVLPQSRGKLL